MDEMVVLWMHGVGRPVDRITFDRYYYLGLILLVIVLGVLFLKLYREWWDIHDVEEPDAPEDLLRSFERAHAYGQIDDQELERVRQRLGVASGSDVGPQVAAPEGGQTRPFPGDSGHPPADPTP